MRQASGKGRSSSEKIVKDIKRATRKQYSAEEKIRIVLDGLRGEDSIAELCRKEGISQEASMISGRKTLWRQARSGLLEIRPVQRPRMKSKLYVVKHVI